MGAASLLLLRAVSRGACYRSLSTAGLDVLCRHTKINLQRDQEGYDGFEYTDEKLSTRRIQWCGLKFYIFFFGELFLKNR